MADLREDFTLIKCIFTKTFHPWKNWETAPWQNDGL